MALDADDLVRIAQLIKLAAETARAFCNAAPVDGQSSAIVEAVNRINAAADDLISCGRDLGTGEGRYHTKDDGA